MTAAAARVQIHTDAYEQAHGRLPRGIGGWGFCPSVVYHRNDYLDHVYWAPSGTSFTESRKAARAHFARLAAETGSEDYLDVEVCS